jgi:hypothetical protein
LARLLEWFIIHPAGQPPSRRSRLSSNVKPLRETALKIETLRIQNWRSIKNLEIRFQDLMIFIGQNNHGKSNVLSAILFFFGEIKPQDLDFNRGAQELFVEAVFTDLDEADKITFKKYLRHDGAIQVRKTACKTLLKTGSRKAMLHPSQSERLQAASRFIRFFPVRGVYLSKTSLTRRPSTSPTTSAA